MAEDKKVKLFTLNRKLFVIMISLVITGFVTSIYMSGVYRSHLNEKYPLMNKQTRVMGIVTNLFIDRITYIDLSGDKHIMVGNLYNYQYESYTASHFIQLGDSLYKKSGSDTLFVIKNGEKYFFVIDPTTY